MKKLSKMKMRSLVILVVSVMFASFLMYAVVANFSLGSKAVDPMSITNLRDSARQLNVSTKYLSDAYAIALQASYQTDVEKRNMILQSGYASIDSFTQLKNALDKSNLSPEQKGTLTKSYAIGTEFVDSYQKQFAQLLGGDLTQARAFVLGSMNRKLQEYRSEVERASEEVNKAVDAQLPVNQPSAGFIMFSVVMGLITLGAGFTGVYYAGRKSETPVVHTEVAASVAEVVEFVAPPPPPVVPAPEPIVVEAPPTVVYMENPVNQENEAKIAKLGTLVSEMKEIAASGNYSRKLDFSSDDEVGQIAECYNTLVDKVHDIAQGVNETSQTLMMLSNKSNKQNPGVEVMNKIQHTAGLLSDIQRKIMDVETRLNGSTGSINQVSSSFGEIVTTINGFAMTTQQVSSNVTNISDSASAISSSINNLSNSSQEVTNSVNTVTGAVKEINVSLNDISKNCERSIQITADAGRKANDTNTIMNKLGTSSKQIEKIINVINDIADQTNMLALNAAIEAAGAGEAGKGFAVVANEVKELAKQTAEATDEISQQIENMQTNMSDAVDAMSTINDVIKEITTITNTIAAAVTEQSATTGEILNSVLKASDRVGNITKEISEIAVNSNMSAKNILETSQGLQEMVRSSSGLANSAIEAAMNIETVKCEIGDITTMCETVVDTATTANTEVEQITNSNDLMPKDSEDLDEFIKNVNELTKKLASV